jgi:CRISPR/Cas system CMR subunit Cmr4 (Cas7 group RAMP superfamily)
MKYFLLGFLFFTTTLSFSQGTTIKGVVEIFDFHSTHRCVTCNTIERRTREVIEKHFAQELNAGKIVFRTVNVDESANAALAKEFQAYGTALFIRTTVNGKKETTNLTEFAFMNVNKKDGSFQQRMQNEIRKALSKQG